MNEELQIKMYTVTLDCKDPRALAEFYAKLLKWVIPFQDESFVCVSAPETAQGAYPGILLQHNPAYEPPVWPQQPEAQQQMAHLDFAVNDLEKAVEHALRCGATAANQQSPDAWRVMLDPAGHPFCLCPMKEMMESAEFALR